MLVMIFAMVASGLFLIFAGWLAARMIRAELVKRPVISVRDGATVLFETQTPKRAEISITKGKWSREIEGGPDGTPS